MASVGSVSSTNTSSFASNATLTIPKPTGLAEGDFMAAIIIVSGDGITTCTASGWSNEEQITGEKARMFLLTKTATSGDVAASNFTFTTNFNGTGTASLAGGIVRVVDWASTVSVGTDAGSDFNRNGTATSITGLSVTPSFDDTILIISLFAEGNEHGGATFSGYSINGTNPTWTEQFEEQNTTGDDVSIAVATATQTTAATVTTISATANATVDDFHAFVVTITPIINVAADLDRINVTPSVQGVTASQVNVATELGRTDITPSVHGIETKATAPTQWTNETKPTTTWTNEGK